MPRARKPPKREKATATINALVPPTMRADFDRWAAGRGLSRSAAVKALIADVLARDPETAPSGLYRPMLVGVHPDARTSVTGVLCDCCGQFHDRPLADGEHCQWCVFIATDPHHAPYRRIGPRLPAAMGAERETPTKPKGVGCPTNEPPGLAGPEGSDTTSRSRCLRQERGDVL